MLHVLICQLGLHGDHGVNVLLLRVMDSIIVKGLVLDQLRRAQGIVEKPVCVVVSKLSTRTFMEFI